MSSSESLSQLSICTFFIFFKGTPDGPATGDVLLVEIFDFFGITSLILIVCLDFPVLDFIFGLFLSLCQQFCP